MIIEEIIIAYLSDRMNVMAYAEEPDSDETGYVVIEKTGSSADENMLHTAMVAIKSYGKELIDAMTLNDAVKEAMQDITSLPGITDVSLNSDYNFTDTQKKKYRYQAVFNITHY